MSTTRRRLNLNDRHLIRLGIFLHAAGLGNTDTAQDAWGRMDSVARAAVQRLGLTAQLTAQGCIPAG